MYQLPGLVLDRPVIVTLFVQHKTIGNKTEQGLLDHGRRFLLIMQTYFGRLHGELPALYFKQCDPAFL